MLSAPGTQGADGVVADTLAMYTPALGMSRPEYFSAQESVMSLKFK